MAQDEDHTIALPRIPTDEERDALAQGLTPQPMLEGWEGAMDRLEGRKSLRQRGEQILAAQPGLRHDVESVAVALMDHEDALRRWLPECELSDRQLTLARALVRYVVDTVVTSDAEGMAELERAYHAIEGWQKGTDLVVRALDALDAAIDRMADGTPRPMVGYALYRELVTLDECFVELDMGAVLEMVADGALNRRRNKGWGRKKAPAILRTIAASVGAWGVESELDAQRVIETATRTRRRRKKI